MALQVVTSWRDLNPAARGASLALGAFDGVHCGHRAVIAGAAEAARRLGAPLGVLTFDPHPRRWLSPGDAPFLLTTPGQQARALAGLGVEWLYRLPFDAAMAELSTDVFASEVLAEGLGARHVSVGRDFTFGKGRQPGPAELEALSTPCGFTVSVAPTVLRGGVKCSSSAIREALAAGRPEDAAAMLGRPFAVEGVVVHGDHLGRTIGFPTANVALGDYIRPATGVYVARTRLPDGREVPGVAYVGRRPTVNGVNERLEVNLLDFDEDLYDQVLETDLIRFIRGEQKFESLDALKAQIARDRDTARALLAPAF